MGYQTISTLKMSHFTAGKKEWYIVRENSCASVQVFATESPEFEPLLTLFLPFSHHSSLESLRAPTPLFISSRFIRSNIFLKCQKKKNIRIPFPHST